MKHAYVSVNSKYIHTSPSVRILYKISKMNGYDSSFFEFTIHTKMNIIINSLRDYDYIFLSCYIWNIEYMKELSSEFRKLRKTTIAGGPEVSYETEAFVNDFDYIMSGEGEELLIPFIESLNNGISVMPEGIANIEHPKAIPQYVKDLKNVPTIFDTYTESDLKNRIIYVETTRGCPFSCSYCLSSLEDGVRFFPDEYVDETFDFIMNNDFKCVKFLDRTFNVKPKRFLELVRRLERTKNTYQFEVQAELFTGEVIDYFKKEAPIGKFRLEAGIQSLSTKTIESVKRIQDSYKLLETLRSIEEEGRTVIHADLIAGLPYEGLDSFRETFNKTFECLFDELQLGFLKMLRGTDIRVNSKKHEYIFDQNPPYEVMSNAYITSNELNKIRECENSLEWLWNDKRARELIKSIMKNIDSFDWFEFFYGFNKMLDKKKPLYENYVSLLKYIEQLGFDMSYYLDDLKLDYLMKERRGFKPFWSDRRCFNEFVLDESYKDSYITSYHDLFIVIKKNEELEILSLKENEENS